MMTRVTDPEILKQLNENNENSQLKKVTDLNILRQLNENNPLEGFINSLKESKNKSIGDLVPSSKQLPIGAKEGFQESLSALPGIGKYFPEPSNQSIPTDVDGANLMRNIGRGIGASPVIGAIGAPIAAAGTALGVPATLAAMGGAAIGGGLSTSGDLFHRGVGALEASLPIGAGKLISKLPYVWKTLRSKINPSELVKSVQQGHDVAEKEASDIFNHVKNEAINRKVNNIKLSDDIFEEAKNSLPKTRANSKLIENSKNGEYENLHKLQSDLGKKGRKKLESDSVAEQDEGEEILDLRNKINEEVEKNFRENGHIDLADKLIEARKKWAKLKKTYYSHPTIGKMVSEETRKVPKNPMSVFSEQSKQMERIHKAHPEIFDAVKLYNEKKLLGKQLKGIGLGSGAALPNIAALKYLLGQNKKPLSEEIIGNEPQGE